VAVDVMAMVRKARVCGVKKEVGPATAKPHIEAPYGG
jgi:hypothetical protein